MYNDMYILYIYTQYTYIWPTATHHCESALVGCTLTRDRLSAAGWVPSADCRFCGKAKESLPHLVFDCAEYHKLTSKPVLHDLGANFALLGIVEHPFRLSQFRLQSEDACIGDAVQFDASLPVLQLWTDGSVLWQPNFWTTTAAYAVVDIDGNIVSTGRVRRWLLSSYVAELWALWMALSRSAAPVHIFCDNKTVVNNANFLLRTGHIKLGWKCLDWWTACQQLVASRRQDHEQPLQVTWIPAHLGDDIPNFQLDPIRIAAQGSSVLHVMRNRDADRAAKDTALRIAPIYPHMAEVVKAATVLHQEWLTRLHIHLDTLQPGGDGLGTSDQGLCTGNSITIDEARAMFPQWEWCPIKAQFPWKPKIPMKVAVPASWKYSHNDWNVICDFARQLRWQHHVQKAFSFCELAILFHRQGRRFDADYQTLLIHDVTCRLRQAFQLLLKLDDVQLCPGSFSATYVKSAGRVLPQSAIANAIPLVEDHVLLYLAQTLCAGCGRSIASWRTTFLEF